MAATSEPPLKRPAIEPLPPSECEPEPMEIEPVARRLRTEAHLVEDRFSDSPHSAGSWSSYDLARSGKRHVQVHDQNRHEVWEERNALQQQVEELQSEMKRVSSQIAARNIQLAQDLESILHGLDERETVAAEALQDAVLQLFEDTLRMPSVATTARMMEILEIQERLRSLWRERPAPPYRRSSP